MTRRRCSDDGRVSLFAREVMMTILDPDIRYLHFVLAYKTNQPQREVARKCGVSQSYLSDVARGVRPIPPERIQRKLADALGIYEGTLFRRLQEVIEVRE